MAADGIFCTAINCMDGRTQRPVIDLLATHFGADYVDSVTEPGPIRILAEQTDTATVESIEKRVRISVEKHGSKGIGIVAHYDCAGNPVDKETQMGQLAASIKHVASRFPNVPIVGIWVGPTWQGEIVA